MEGSCEEKVGVANRLFTKRKICIYTSASAREKNRLRRDLVMLGDVSFAQMTSRIYYVNFKNWEFYFFFCVERDGALGVTVAFEVCGL